MHRLSSGWILRSIHDAVIVENWPIPVSCFPESSQPSFKSHNFWNISFETSVTAEPSGQQDRKFCWQQMAACVSIDYSNNKFDSVSWILNPRQSGAGSQTIRRELMVSLHLIGIGKLHCRFKLALFWRLDDHSCDSMAPAHIVFNSSDCNWRTVASCLTF